MSEGNVSSRRSATYITQLAALGLVVGSYFLVRTAQAPMREKQELASRFHFTRFDIPTEKFATGKLRKKHLLHPSLERAAGPSTNGTNGSPMDGSSPASMVPATAQRRVTRRQQNEIDECGSPA